MQVHATLLRPSLSRHLAASASASVASALQLQLSFGPAGPPEPPRLSAQGAAWWVHVHSGSVRVHALPGTEANLAVLIKGQQGKAARGKAYGGAVVLTCTAGDTILLPAGWLASKELLEPSVMTSALACET
jgi:hypothetical protein